MYNEIRLRENVSIDIIICLSYIFSASISDFIQARANMQNVRQKAKYFDIIFAQHDIFS